MSKEDSVGSGDAAAILHFLVTFLWLKWKLMLISIYANNIKKENLTVVYLSACVDVFLPCRDQKIINATRVQWYYILSPSNSSLKLCLDPRHIFMCYIPSNGNILDALCIILYIFPQNSAGEPDLVSLETWGFSLQIKYIAVGLSNTWPHNISL